MTRDRNILFNVSKAAWQDDVKEALFVQVGLFKELQSLAANSEKRDETIQKAKRGLKRSQNDRDNLLKQKQDLVAEAKKKKILLDTKTEDKHLEDLEKGESVLERFIEEQQKIAAEENDPKRKKWRSEVARAKLLEQDLEIGKAIDIYVRIKGEGFQDPGLDPHLKELQDLWKTADADHQDARNFVYRVWPTLETTRLKENLPKARKAFEKCVAEPTPLPSAKCLREPWGTRIG